jgi:hypothetical protein
MSKPIKQVNITQDMASTVKENVVVQKQASNEWARWDVRYVKDE